MMKKNCLWATILCLMSAGCINDNPLKVRSYPVNTDFIFFLKGNSKPQPLKSSGMFKFDYILSKKTYKTNAEFINDFDVLSVSLEFNVPEPIALSYGMKADDLDLIFYDQFLPVSMKGLHVECVLDNLDTSVNDNTSGIHAKGNCQGFSIEITLEFPKEENRGDQRILRYRYTVVARVSQPTSSNHAGLIIRQDMSTGAQDTFPKMTSLPDGSSWEIAAVASKLQQVTLLNKNPSNENQAQAEKN